MLYLRKYKFWKQFTTQSGWKFLNAELCCIYENTNFESNSQPTQIIIIIIKGCVVSTKIQILKAIHNSINERHYDFAVVLYLRKYKFWKQFTTGCVLFVPFRLLCCIYENTNFESNSQLLLCFVLMYQCCVVSTKIQILKAIHNLYNICQDIICVVLYLRKYKFWKQFTTIIENIFLEILLCCIYENTNFESNSQLNIATKETKISCVVSTKIQILKAIHNSEWVEVSKCRVVLYLRKYKFWKQFTTKISKISIKTLLCCIYENTNFESNSQHY